MREYYRRQLPHIHPLHATYFITFRLVHSLPSEISDQLKREYTEYENKLMEQSGTSNDQQRCIALEEYHHAYFCAFDDFLDGQKEGNRWLSEAVIADTVRTALHYRDEKVYDLICYSIMPNHVHMICTIDGTAYTQRRSSRGSRITRHDDAAFFEALYGT